MSPPLNNKTKYNSEPLVFLLDEFNAVIKYLNSRGEKRLAEYLIEQIQFSDEFAMPIRRERFHYD